MIGLVIGRTRSGKSVLAQWLVRRLARVIFCDPTGEMGPTDHIVRAFPEDAKAIDWSAKKLRVLWLAPPEWDFFCSLDNVTVVLDEADKHWPAGASVDELDPALVNLVARCARYGVHLLAVSQSPHQMPPFIRGQAARAYLLSIMNTSARKACWEEWKLTPPEKRYKYVYWSDGECQ